jgi:hypothetical protein
MTEKKTTGRFYRFRDAERAEIRNALTLPKAVLQLLIEKRSLPKPVLRRAVKCLDRVERIVRILE